MPQPTQNSAHRISRRAVLRGAGVTVALPWLPSLTAFADTPSAATFPKRFAVLFMGNGINEDYWSAEGSGPEMKLSKTLSGMEPLKNKINVIDGLFNKAATGQGIHPAQTGSLLSGAERRAVNEDRGRHPAGCAQVLRQRPHFERRSLPAVQQRPALYPPARRI